MTLEAKPKFIGRTTFAALSTAVLLGSGAAAVAQQSEWTGPGAMNISAEGPAIWQLPGKRALDPKLFGTPDAPLATQVLPLAARETNADGTAFTTTREMTPFSNNIREITGNFSMSVRDNAARDGLPAKDEVALESTFKGPGGKEYRVVVDRVIPKGPDHPFFGGVGTNVLMHGSTGIGTPFVVREMSYAVLWGIGDLYVDGEKVDGGRVVHVMVSERTRDENYQLGFEVAQPDELEVHLMLPNTKVSPTGPVTSPVPTAMVLANGDEQPFIHVNFYGNIKVTGNHLVPKG